MGERLRVRRARAFDVAVAVVAGGTSVAAASHALDWRIAPADPPGPLAYGLLLVAALALVVRRAQPVPVLAVTAAAGATYLALRYPVGPVFQAMAVALYTVAVVLPIRRSLGASAAALAVLMAGHTVRDPGDMFSHGAVLLPWAAAWALLPWAIGSVVGARREAAARDREEAQNRQVFEERLRVAREIHDVVGHGLAVINMRAGIALHVLERRPEQATVALEAIKQASKDALEELRATLAVFRNPDGGGGAGGGGDAADGREGREVPRRPPPGLAQLGGLVSAMASSGLPVEVAVDGEERHLPAAVDLAAYRIVQESLTNVLRHAGPARATVRVGYEPDGVVIEVSDDGAARTGAARGGAAPGDSRTAGHGIAGMTERAASVGGSLTAGPGTDGFVVRARLPCAGAQARSGARPGVGSGTGGGARQ